MSVWPQQRLDDVVVFLNNRRIPLKAADRAKRQGQYPYYGASGIVDHLDDYLFDGKYLLISEDGENLRSRTTPIAFRVQGRFWVNNHAHIVDEREPGVLDFLEYAFSTFDLNPFITGAAQPKLNKRTLQEIKLPIPPKRERLAINGILNALTDKIELNRRMNRTLEAMARALFRSWFVDFDPVRARAEGRAPAHMDPATAALFPARFGEDGLPEGWGRGPLSTICASSKASIDPREHKDALFDHFSIPAFDAGAGPVRQPGAEIMSNKLVVPDGAILFSRLNPSIPRVWWARTRPDVFASVGSTEYLVAQPRRGTASAFLYSLLVSDEFRAEVVARVTGTSNSHQRVKPGSVLEIEIVVPAANVVTAFEDVTQRWFDRVQANLDQSRTLAALRDALLPKLMSGELRVRDAERALAAAV